MTLAYEIQHYFSLLRTRIAQAGWTEASVARAAGLRPQHLSTLINRSVDCRRSTLLRLEAAMETLRQRQESAGATER
jgi:plasmid maintenance system antidote protein VapI